jgi:hypothetical protein
MRNAQYLRAQAEFCLQAARRISDHKTVANLKVDAARYHDEATEVEAEHHGDPTSTDPKLPGGDEFSQTRDRHAKNDLNSSDEMRAYFRLLRHLLGEKLQASFKEDQARPLSPRMADLLKKLEHPTSKQKS